MRKAFFLTLFVLAVAVPVVAQDPVKVDPKHYKVEFENSQVRVLRVHYGAHEKSVWHRHPNSVVIAVTDVNSKFNLPGGKTQDSTLKAGQTLWTPAGKHLPENVSDSDFEVILVEMKTRRKPAVKKPADATAPPSKQ
jgi:quercetin dioxygenase-like cupin family protein